MNAVTRKITFSAVTMLADTANVKQKIEKNRKKKTDTLSQLLVHQQCDPNVQNREGDTPLHLACHKRSLDVVKLFLEKRCSNNIPNTKGEIAQNIPLNEDGDCLLHIVCQWGDVDIVRYLVTDERCNPNLVFKVSTTEKTPLHIAAKYGQDATLFKCCHV